MKVALIGPLCKDVIMCQGKRSDLPGGVVYYTGNALSALDVDSTLYASCAVEDLALLQALSGERIVHLPSSATHVFLNEYPKAENTNYRVQRVLAQSEAPVPAYFSCSNDQDAVVFGPLLRQDLSEELLRKFPRRERNILAVQGLIRVVENGSLAWRRDDSLLRLCSYVGTVIADVAELLFLTETKNLEEAVSSLGKAGVKRIIATMGAQGSWHYLLEREKETHKIPAFPPRQMVDPTGAGDTYLAGLIKAQELFQDPYQQGLFAAMTATMKIEQQGPFKGSVEEVIERLREVSGT